eukprot:1857487-Ditylum_brightwellii.AAC.1
MPAEHPILDTKDHLVRSLIALILGAGVCKRGVPNHSSAHVYDFIVKKKIFKMEQEQAHQKVIEYILNKSRKK